jgi:predicted MFS family arabinose efflux permease
VGRLAESWRAFGDVYRNADLRRLQLAWAGSVAGQYSSYVALAVYAYGHGGAAALGALGLIRTIPPAVLAPFMSVAGDRYRQERVMLAADLGRAAVTGAIAVIAFAHGPAILVFVLAAIGPVCSTAFHPAEAALLPAIARTPEELTAANVSSSTIDSVAAFAGPAVGGAVLAGWGIGAALLVTVATFLWSASLVARVRPAGGVGPAEPEPEPSAPEPLLREALAGFRTVLGDQRLRVIVGLFAGQAAVAGAMGVLVVVAALRLLDLGEGGVGWLYSACGVGGVVGAAIALALVARRRLGSDFAVGLVLWGLPFVVIGVWSSPAVALLMLGVLGIGNTLVDISAMTLVQRNAPDDVRARVFGVMESLFAAAVGVGSVAAPILIGLAGVRAALIVTGVFLPALVVLMARRLRALDTSAPPAHLELLEAIPLFAPLSPAILEGLARSLVPVRLQPGETLFRAGDEGDRFYVVAAGELEIELPGATKMEGAGGWVGEIALLRDVPRTATVRSRSETELLALDRDEFLAAVTGHAHAYAAATAVASERIAFSTA